MSNSDILHILTENPCQETPEAQWERIRESILGSGACACGVSTAEPVAENIREEYGKWLSEGRHAGMAYMERYIDIRTDPRLLLEGAESIISIAYSYHTDEREQYEGSPYIANYAIGDDYHDVIRERLRPIAEEIKQRYGAECRICIDSAPIHERYWAVKSGIGERCANGAIYIPGYGSEVFLAELITTLKLPANDRRAPEDDIRRGCQHCGLCRNACPGEALHSDGTIDSGRCINYLTIEHRGDFNESQLHLLRRIEPTLFGCDRCQQVCPLNKGIGSTPIANFQMRASLKFLTIKEIEEMTPAEFSRRFKGSPIKRAKLAGLLRNLIFTLRLI
ncbi:MAG: tRNA epoxyqueuosine(34) reductase QueG [Bacteroidales bacterium]|nr:tRNA epoxyqueuosine(34) reductase QueG [Bacteroidales bacterium]